LSYSFIFRHQFFFSGLEITGHGNPDNNLESHCTVISLEVLRKSVEEVTWKGQKIEFETSIRRSTTFGQKNEKEKVTS
jgi:hypothetical protein